MIILPPKPESSSTEPAASSSSVPSLTLARARERSHFDTSMPQQQDDPTRVVYTSALAEPNPDPDDPDHHPPYNAVYELTTYHKVPLHRTHPLMQSVTIEGSHAHLGGAFQINRLFNNKLPRLPTVPVHVIIKIRVVESEMHKALREVEGIEGFLGSRLGIEWRNSAFCKDTDWGMHKILFDPTEATGGRDVGLVILM